jgi:hypothetical protein
MPRGMVWAIYLRDDGVTGHARLVDADQVQQPARGWGTSGVANFPIFPQQCRPRRVLGSSPTTGQRGYAVIGNTGAPLWRGTVTTFTVAANDGTVDTMAVVGRVGERFRTPRE